MPDYFLIAYGNDYYFNDASRSNIHMYSWAIILKKLSDIAYEEIKSVNLTIK